MSSSDHLENLAIGAFVQITFTLVIRVFGSIGLITAFVVVLPLTAFVFIRPWLPDIAIRAAQQIDGVEIQRTSDGSLERRTRNPESVAALNAFGVNGGSPSLDDSPYEPYPILTSTKESLSFMGISAEKWIEPKRERVAFSEMVKRVGSKDVKVRFLLLNPEWNGYENYVTTDGARGSPVEHFKYFVDLMREHENFEVRLYDYRPTFRLIFKDDDYLVLSRYLLEKDQLGWEQPQLEINKDAEYSLYRPFKDEFFNHWRRSEPLQSDGSDSSH